VYNKALHVVCFINTCIWAPTFSDFNLEALRKDPSISIFKIAGGWVCSSLVEHIFSMQEALNSIPSTKKKKRRKKRKERKTPK
jgi:putative component of membrane protein insertase Oxa1/YidC/SpoIIIJ protein YidD